MIDPIYLDRLRIEVSSQAAFSKDDQRELFQFSIRISLTLLIVSSVSVVP